MTLRDVWSRTALLCASAAVALVAYAGEASADMVQTNDGKWWPADFQAVKDSNLGPEDEPADDLLRLTEEYKVTAEYDTVKLSRGGFNRPAGQVRKIRTSDRAGQAFKRGLLNADAGHWQDAAQDFLDAQNDASPAGKQEAMYLREEALAQVPDVDGAKQAAQDMLAAFPKSFYFANAQILLARVAASTGTGSISKPLAAVAEAPGMNARDMLQAEWWRIKILEEGSGKWDAARQSYEKLADAAGKAPPEEGGIIRQQAQVGIANALVGAGKQAEAQPYYEKAIAESRDPAVLAAAYAGLGDVVFSMAKDQQRAGKPKEALETLGTVVLHYLRVSLLYKDQADFDVLTRTLENQAKAFSAMFDISGMKDCDAFRRAYASYEDLVRLLPDSPQKKQLIRDAKALLAKRDSSGCK
jgi:tetratricopeptide (TPR) repeat protein